MGVLRAILAGSVCLLLSAWLGYVIGLQCRRLPRSRYWIANGAGLLTGFALADAGAATGWTWLWAAGLCTMAGSMTGLKYGLGRSVGIRRLVGKETGPEDDAGRPPS